MKKNDTFKNALKDISEKTNDALAKSIAEKALAEYLEPCPCCGLDQDECGQSTHGCRHASGC